MDTTQSEIKGLTYRKNNNGFMAVFLHYSAHPEKDTDTYRTTIREGLDEQSVQREHELDFSSLEGSKIIREFSMSQVIPTNTNFLIDRPFECGIDWGFRTPAFLMTQFTKDFQWIWNRLFVGYEIDTKTFLYIVKYLRGQLMFDILSDAAKRYIDQYKLTPWLEYPTKHKFFDYCDSAGTARSDKGDLSNIALAGQPPYNLRLIYKKTPLEAGINLLSLRFRKRETKTTNITPTNVNEYATLVDNSCMLAIQGLQGGFVRDKHGRIPDNLYTNIFDAARYIIVNKSNERMEQEYFLHKTRSLGELLTITPKPQQYLNNDTNNEIFNYNRNNDQDVQVIERKEGNLIRIA